MLRFWSACHTEPVSVLEWQVWRKSQSFLFNKKENAFIVESEAKSTNKIPHQVRNDTSILWIQNDVLYKLKIQRSNQNICCIKDRIPSVCRNKERRSASAKRSLSHEASKVSGAQQFPHTDLIFWFIFYQEKMNRRESIWTTIFNTNQKSKSNYDMGKKPIQQTRFHIKYGTTHASGEYKTMFYKNQT